MITPPPKSLGVYELPPLTHNGEELIIDGEVRRGRSAEALGAGRPRAELGTRPGPAPRRAAPGAP